MISALLNASNASWVREPDKRNMTGYNLNISNEFTRRPLFKITHELLREEVECEIDYSRMN